MPSQEQVDQCGHYAEAVAELRASPFFGADSQHLGTTFQPGGTTQFRVADRIVLDAALHPFRRIWQQTEASNFIKVYKILCKYTASTWHNGLVAYARGEFDRFEKGYGPFAPTIQVTPRHLVNCWIYTQTAHTGEGGTANQPKRSDFERLKSQLGLPQLEYLFNLAIYNFSICFMNLGSVNDIYLRKWEMEHNLRPSFPLRVSSSTYRNSTATGDQIVRKTPGFTAPTETSRGKLDRLLRREGLNRLGKVLEWCHLSYDDIVAALNAELKLSAFLRPPTFQVVENLEPINAETKYLNSDHFVDHESRQVGSLLRLMDGQVLADCAAFRILDRDFERLRKHMSG